MSRKKRNHIIHLQISEPLDFDVPGKGNVLETIFEGPCQGPSKPNWRGEYLLLSLREPISWQGQGIKQLLISPRYEGDSVKDFLSGKQMMVGIARAKPGISLSTRAPFSEVQVDYFAIGSAKIV